MRFAHRLLFIRHGETDWNVAGRLQGQRDIPLNARGCDQATAAGRTVRKIIGADAVGSALAYVASPRGRARQTMELARAALGLPPQAYAMDARLMELSFGSWEGLTWPEVQARAPEAAVARETRKWDFVPPGGESYAMLALRVAPWLDELDGDTLVVSHGGVARVLMALIGGVAHERASVSNIWQGRLLVFGSGGFSWL
jgi:probable phosphoglycerate mutase